MSDILDPERANLSKLWVECRVWGYALEAISRSKSRKAAADLTNLRWLIRRRLEPMAHVQQLVMHIDRITDEMAEAAGKERAAGFLKTVVDSMFPAQEDVFDGL